MSKSNTYGHDLPHKHALLYMYLYSAVHLIPAPVDTSGRTSVSALLYKHPWKHVNKK